LRALGAEPTRPRAAEPAFVAPSQTAGYNTVWRTYQSTVPTVAMGSVLCVTLPALTPDQARRLLRDGIGEERRWGLGRIALSLLSASAPERAYPVEVGRERAEVE